MDLGSSTGISGDSKITRGFTLVLGITCGWTGVVLRGLGVCTLSLATSNSFSTSYNGGGIGAEGPSLSTTLGGKEEEVAGVVGPS